MRESRVRQSSLVGRGHLTFDSTSARNLVFKNVAVTISRAPGSRTVNGGRTTGSSPPQKSLRVGAQVQVNLVVPLARGDEDPAPLQNFDSPRRVDQCRTGSVVLSGARMS